ncbi:hypothetical protein Fmac_032800 [Flemingia macrophylla]|uniref:Uncharacterized protein n=1 Tax=Flemingia macrophylla TaxID=520843 RepID=A0ABD1L5Y1_9FABA
MRKLEGKLDTLVNLVTQLAANQKPASIARGCSIRNHAIVIRGVHDVATDTPAETRKLEGKLDAIVNFVTQLAANQKPASVARVCGLRSSNDHHTSVFPSSQQSGVDEHPETYAANTYSWPPQKQRQGVHDVAIDTSAETRKLEGKLDALVNLVTRLATNQKPTSVVRVCGPRSSNDHHTSVCPSSQQSGVDEHLETYVANSYSRPPQQQRQGVHDVATDKYAETRKLEGKLDAFVNLVTQLAANQKRVSVARVCGIHSSNDHHTSVCHSSHQSGVDEHPEAYAANTYSRPPQQGVQDVATGTSAEARKLEGKLNVLVNLVTQLAMNQKPPSVARVCGLRSSNDHHTSLSARNDIIVTRGVHDVATDTSVKTRKLEGKLDALVNLVTQQLGMRSMPIFQEPAASVLPMTSILVSVILPSYLEWMSILRLMLQTTIEGHRSSRDKALDREDGS